MQRLEAALGLWDFSARQDKERVLLQSRRLDRRSVRRRAALGRLRRILRTRNWDGKQSRRRLEPIRRRVGANRNAKASLPPTQHRLLIFCALYMHELSTIETQCESQQW